MHINVYVRDLLVTHWSGENLIFISLPMYYVVRIHFIEVRLIYVRMLYVNNKIKKVYGEIHVFVS